LINKIKVKNRREGMKKILKKLINAWLYLPLKVASAPCRDKFNAFFFRTICETVEKNTDYFVSYNLRPKRAENFISRESVSENANDYAIIMQGPLVKENNFTLETVKLYNKIYPNVQIIVSTWNTEDAGYVSEIRKCNDCEVLLNELPEYCGFGNLNYQTYSTVEGLKRAKDLNKKFVFKTRCDYRFYKRGLLDYMRSLLMMFPCSDENMSQKYRIVITSGRHDDMFKQFYVGDQFNFGFISDMLNFWDHDLTDVNYPPQEMYKEFELKHLTWKEERDICRNLTRRYIRKMTSSDVPNTIEAYWEFARKYLIFLSAKDVDAYWCKYENRFEETESNGEYYRKDSMSKYLAYNWNFSSWLNLYSGTLKWQEWMEKISENNHY
jgi:hypothetical protein